MEPRETFDTVAELYDRARPGYPPELFSDLAALTGLSAGSRVLEIGPGTGQATRGLVECGYNVVAIELGPALATVARRNFAGNTAVEVINARFEDWPLPAEQFDLVFSATAFHWLDPAVRLAKCAAALRPGGALAVVATDHVEGGTSQFFADAQECYERHMPGTPAGLRSEVPAAVPDAHHGLDAPGPFEAPQYRRYLAEHTYTTSEYLDVINTYSSNLVLLPADREALDACLAALIDSRYGGRVTKAYLHQLTLARKH